MSLLKCPTCNQKFDSEQSQSVPFCSVRCQQVDLGRWLGEQYGVPWTGAREDDDWSEESDDTAARQ